MKRAIAIAAAIAAPALVLTACHDSTTDYPGDGTTTYTGTTDYEFPPDPYSSNGVWRIPGQVKPGVYTMLPNSDQVISLRWMALCRDVYCQDSIDESVRYANNSGGPVYITIPGDGSVKAYENNGVRLAPPEG